MLLSLRNVGKVIDNKWILKNISLNVNAKEIVGVIGPSGGGKSTLLRCINGLEAFQEGTVELQGIKPEDIGMVFQHFNLFPHMTVMENLTYAPIKVLKKEPKQAQELALSALKDVGLEEFYQAYPRNLSGGQKQRAAIARMLCMKPKVILFDEPTSALDPENVKEVLEVIKSLHNITIIIVSHEIKFIMEVATRVLFIEGGRILEDSNAKNFFAAPQSPRAREFLSKVF